jgi:DNA-binding LacI/PurR family transcriptional regulator
MSSPRRATIADVAAAWGVGVGTVSRVINGAANVREATRVSVLRVIDQLGYRPSHLAASLSRGTARTMAIVVPHLTRPSVVMRLAGALAVAGIDYDAGLVRRGPYGPANAEALAAELLALPDRPSAIFAASDTQAMGVLTAADRCGLPVLGRLSVIGFDDIESAALLGLSTVRQPLERSGAEGARRLCALLRGERVRPPRQQLALEVVQRSSTANFRVTGPRCGSAAVRPRRADGRTAAGTARVGQPASRRPGKGNVTRRPARRCDDALAGNWRLEG